MLPEADSPVWYYAAIFTGLWALVFTAVLALSSALAGDNALLLIENAILFVIFGALRLVSTAIYEKDERT